MELNCRIITIVLVSILIVTVYGQGYGRRPRPGGRPRPRPGPRPGPGDCMSVGVCGGFVNADCPAGSTCRHVWPTQTAGLCCKDKEVPQLPVCKQPKVTGPCRGAIPRWFYNSKTKACESFIYGGCGGNENNFERRADCERRCGVPTKPNMCGKNKTPGGSCGGFVGAPCGLGYTCIYRPGSSLGTCCPDEQKPNICGKNKIPGESCGGIVGAQCRPGYTCKYMPFSTLGTCCPNERVSGTCPPDTGRPGICLFDPEVNCLSDEFCGNGQLCCPEGCGSVCKNPVYGDLPNQIYH